MKKNASIAILCGAAACAAAGIAFLLYKRKSGTKEEREQKAREAYIQRQKERMRRAAKPDTADAAEAANTPVYENETPDQTDLLTGEDPAQSVDA